MNIFRRICENTGTNNKIANKIQGGGAYCTNNIVQKCLSFAVSLALMLGVAPGNLAQAAEPTTFVSTAKANHWGRSDLRAYLNNATKSDNTLPIDTATGGTRSGNFPAKFSEAEFALVQPFTYQTNVLDSSANATATYETTDRFWLPSGNYTNNQVTSWGGEDISANAQYSKSKATDKARIIPISYWSYGALTYSWLRSPRYYNDCYTLPARRGNFILNYIVDYSNVAFSAACKINLESDICGPVIFASAASAANLVRDGGAQKIEIAGSADFGKKTTAALPDYGMYLKTASGKTFSANSLSLSSSNLTVGYTGGEAGQYVVVQAFNEDSLTDGTTGYAAAKQLEAGQTSATINVANWGISSLDDYTVKVWMEDSTGSLAKATVPTTFVGTSKTESGAVKNGRVFAMKADLQCSWGDLAELSDDDYNKILVGKSTTQTGAITGVNPTNQKIYFGSHNGNPLEFWIAGRETAANGGAIDEDGDIMTLYQAKSVETKRFNASSSNYNVDGKPSVTLQLTEDPINASYDGSIKAYPTDKITTVNLVDGYKLTWQHRKAGATAWTNGMPTELGTYEVQCYAPGTDNYERTYSNIVSFVIKKAPKSSDFVCTHPKDMFYDGKGKSITITPKPGITGMGDVTIKYYKVNSDGTLGAASTTLPTDAGRYKVKFDVAEGTSYAAATDLPAMF